MRRSKTVSDSGDSLLVKTISIRQRDAARENLALAVDTMSGVHAEIMDNWISQEQSLTDAQFYLLRQTARSLTQLSKRYEASGGPLGDAGYVSVRAASMNERLDEYSLALEQYNRAALFLAKALESSPGGRSLQSSLAAAHEGRSRIHFARWEFAEAEKAAKAAVRLRDLLQKQNPKRLAYVLSRFDAELHQLEVAGLDDSSEALMRRGQLLVDEMNELFRTSKVTDLRDAADLEIKKLTILIEISSARRALGHLDEAVSRWNNDIRKARMSLKGFGDDRRITRRLAEAEAEFARCQMETGAFQDAEANLRSAIEQVRSSFVFDGTPKEFSYAYMNERVSHSQMEPEAFRLYARIQATLADLLNQTGRRSLAFAEANDATRTCLTLANLYPKRPRKRNACSRLHEEPSNRRFP